MPEKIALPTAGWIIAEMLNSKNLDKNLDDMPLIKTIERALSGTSKAGSKIDDAEMQEILSGEDHFWSAPKSLGTFVDNNEKLILEGLELFIATGVIKADRKAIARLNAFTRLMPRLPSREAYTVTKGEEWRKKGAVAGAVIGAVIGGRFLGAKGLAFGLLLGAGAGGVLGDQLGRLYGKNDN